MGRVADFHIFSSVVLEHIKEYTIPQYGDSPGDEVDSWSAEQCVKAIQKYTKRHEACQRGRLELLRDLIKIAHFSAIAFWKMRPTAEEILKITGGKT